MALQPAPVVHELSASGLTWINVVSPDVETAQELAERFGWHPLDVEDIVSKRQRPKVDDYGCGDAFAAALTYGLGAGLMLDEAIGLAARCGAAVLCGRGPYGAMLGGDAVLSNTPRI